MASVVSLMKEKKIKLIKGLGSLETHYAFTTA